MISNEIFDLMEMSLVLTNQVLRRYRRGGGANNTKMQKKKKKIFGQGGACAAFLLGPSMQCKESKYGI